MRKIEMRKMLLLLITLMTCFLGCIEHKSINTAAGQNSAVNILEKGKQEFFQENYQAGISYFTLLLKESRNFLPGHRWLARSLIMLEEYNPALLQIEQGLAIAPDDPELLTLSGIAKSRQGDFKNALADLHTAAALYLKSAEAYIELSGIYLLFGLTDESLYYRELARSILEQKRAGNEK